MMEYYYYPDCTNGETEATSYTAYRWWSWESGSWVCTCMKSLGYAAITFDPTGVTNSEVPDSKHNMSFVHAKQWFI